MQKHAIPQLEEMRALRAFFVEHAGKDDQPAVLAVIKGLAFTPAADRIGKEGNLAAADIDDRAAQAFGAAGSYDFGGFELTSVTSFTGAVAPE